MSCCCGKKAIELKVAEKAYESASGAPKKVSTSLGDAYEFNGVDDALFFNENQLKGLEGALTLECTFYVDGTGNFEQRFLHIGEVNEERIMLEIRVNPDKTWYFDAHTATTGNASWLTLIDPEILHPTDCWVNGTLVINNGTLTSYVNGVKECEGQLEYTPIGTGITSVGCRQNKVSWFKGMVYSVIVTPKALSPEEFNKDYEKLNAK